RQDNQTPRGSNPKRAGEIIASNLRSRIKPPSHQEHKNRYSPEPGASFLSLSPPNGERAGVRGSRLISKSVAFQSHKKIDPPFLSHPGEGEGLELFLTTSHHSRMSLKQIARNLRRNQTEKEKQLWRALRGRQFAGFKFRRQYVAGDHILDFYCAAAKLAVELDGFQHGLPEGIQKDKTRDQFLADQDIEVVRFWNHQWRKNRDGCLLEIWNAVQRRTGLFRIMDNAEEQKFIPPDPKQIKLNPSP